LYRIYPKGAKLRTPPRLEKMTTTELVAALDSPNGWQRDTIQRLFYQSQDKSAIPLLEKLMITCSRPKTRLQAMCTLDGLNGLTPETILRGLNDPNFYVREHAVRLSEQFLKPSTNIYRKVDRLESELKPKLLTMVNDPEIRVRYQLAFSLGEWIDPRASEALVKIAARDVTNDEVQVAVMSSVPGHVAEMLKCIFTSTNPPPAKITKHLVDYAVWSQDAAAVEAAVKPITSAKNGKFEEWQLAGTAGFLDAVEARRTLSKQYKNSESNIRMILEKIDSVIGYARGTEMKQKATLSERGLCVRLLGRGLNHQLDDLNLLLRFFHRDSPRALQEPALLALGHIRLPELGALIVSNWLNYVPDVRLDLLELLTARSKSAETVLRAIETNSIGSEEIPQYIRERLLNSRNELISKHAKQVFGKVESNRTDVLKRYRGSLTLLGDSYVGATLFAKNCTPCHEFAGNGMSLGPNLSSVAKKSSEELLISILDPSSSIEPRYIASSVLTRDDREITGILASQTDTSITIRKPGGAEESLSRTDVIRITTSKRSLMPEGFEIAISPQQMADLIAYIKSAGHQSIGP
ncbi:MAG: hypothetical protein ACXWJX_15145, partial [Limisphaerales bacterium]